MAENPLAAVLLCKRIYLAPMLYQLVFAAWLWLPQPADTPAAAMAMRIDDCLKSNNC